MWAQHNPWSRLKSLQENAVMLDTSATLQFIKLWYAYHNYYPQQLFTWHVAFKKLKYICIQFKTE